MFYQPTGSTASMTSASTLTETVSIDYEDFSDNFLKCSTCLCLYETVEHNPKLLPCSHTVCHACLERIVAMSGPDCTSFRCPICREVVPVPRGGVPSFPPSFVINQLLDLMARQRRDVVPKCSRHAQSELMFCESCDDVFCTECCAAVGAGAAGGGAAHSNKAASGHTVIPFSVAIKRMSEILLYKSGLCMKNLDRASSAVAGEMQRLDVAADRCLDAAGLAFQVRPEKYRQIYFDVINVSHRVCNRVALFNVIRFLQVKF
jgi:tripartite motif-containing protein 2/3